MRSNSSKALLLLAVVVAGLWAVLGQPASSGSESQLEPAKEETTRQRVEDEGAAAEAARRPSSVLGSADVVRFFDAKTDEVVRGVSVLRVRPNSSWVARRTPCLAKSREDGTIARHILVPWRRLLAVADGYLPVKLASRAPSVTEIRMSAARSAQFKCLSLGGRPVPGCRVLIAKTHLRAPPTFNDERLAVPGARTRLWGAVTDQKGVARVSGLEPGKYRVHVASDTWVAVNAVHKGLRDLYLPTRTEEVRMTRLVGAVVALPRGAGRSKVLYWGYRSRRRLQRSGPHRAAMALLTKRFPDMAIRIAGEMVGGQTSGAVDVTAVLDNGAHCAAVAELRPVDEVVPQVLTIRKIVPTREVRLLVPSLADSSEAKIFALKTGKYEVKLSPGTVQVVPCGSYEVSNAGPEAPGSHLWKPDLVSVRPGTGIQEIYLETEQLRVLKVRVALSEPDVNEPVALGLECALGGSMRGELVSGDVTALIVPYGNAVLTARAEGYKTVRKAVVVGAKALPVIELSLRERHSP